MKNPEIFQHSSETQVGYMQTRKYCINKWV